MAFVRPSNQEILEYYLDLLIIQYKDKPNIRGTLAAILETSLVQDLLFDIREAFDLETATGKQLDIIGKYVGVDRFYSGFILENKFFAFATYDDETPSTFQAGFSDYTDFESKEGGFLTYNDVASGSLSLGDEDYRTIIKLKIIKNNINHSQKSIDDGLFQFFEDQVRASSMGNMKITYFTPTDLGVIIDIAIQKKVLPRPLSVGFDYVVKNDDPFFGFVSYGTETPSPFIKGFSTYATFDTDDGNTLKYSNLEEV